MCYNILTKSEHVFGKEGKKMTYIVITNSIDTKATIVPCVSHEAAVDLIHEFCSEEDVSFYEVIENECAEIYYESGDIAYLRFGEMM